MHTLRYYERIGLLDGVERRGNGHRVFRATAMTWLAFLLREREVATIAALTALGNATP